MDITSPNRRLITAVVSAAAALAIAIAVYGKGCSSDENEAKLVALRFLAASRAGEPRLMLELMSERTRTELDAAARKATELVGGSRRFEAVDMISVGARSELEAPSVVERERGEGFVLFEVKGGADTTMLRLVLEDGQWRVDVPEYVEARDRGNRLR